MYKRYQIRIQLIEIEGNKYTNNTETIIENEVYYDGSSGEFSDLKEAKKLFWNLIR